MTNHPNRSKQPQQFRVGQKVEVLFTPSYSSSGNYWLKGTIIEPDPTFPPGFYTVKFRNGQIGQADAGHMNRL